jgi:cytochrome c oxidase subunit III
MDTKKGEPGASATEAVLQVPLAHHFRDPAQQHETATLGMWVFLATELMVFGGLFTGYAAYRYQYPREFDAASRELNIVFGGVNTVVLLTSSLTMALGVWAAQLGRRRLLVWMLVATAALGTLFLIIKFFEYREDYEKNLVPGLAFDPAAWRAHECNPRHVQLFLMFYYIMTGLHAVHLIIGIGLIGILAVMAGRGSFGPVYYSPVEVGGLYWHFVDVIWIFLLPLLYLAGTRS